LVSTSKDPTKVRAGLLGAEKRWSDPANRRVARLDDLSPEARRLVLALVDAARHADEVKGAA